MTDRVASRRSRTVVLIVIALELLAAGWRRWPLIGRPEPDAVRSVLRHVTPAQADSEPVRLLRTRLESGAHDDAGIAITIDRTAPVVANWKAGELAREVFDVPGPPRHNAFTGITAGGALGAAYPLGWVGR